MVGRWHTSPKNQFRESKKIPYAVPIFEPDTPASSRCEYSSAPSILSIEQKVSYPWEITLVDLMTDFQVQTMTKTKSPPRMRSLDKLLVEGTQGNPYSALSSSKSVAEVASTSISSFLGGTSSRSSDRSSRSLSSEGAPTSSSSHEGPSIP